MTRHRKEFAREGAQNHFYSPAAIALMHKLKVTAGINATRIPCAKCGLMILPSGMQRHIDIVHTDEETTS